jgi:hypothetical protein
MRGRRGGGGAVSGALARFIAILGVGFPLLAFGADLTSPAAPPAGSSPGFRDGYSDGCLTGFADAGRDGYQESGRKDAARYLREEDYKAGFEAGHRACYDEQMRNPRTLNL